MNARIAFMLASSLCLFMSTGVNAQGLPDLKIVKIIFNPTPSSYLQYPALKTGTTYEMTLHIANTLPVNVHQDIELVVYFKCVTQCGGPLRISTYGGILKGISGNDQQRWSFRFTISYPGNYSFKAIVDERNLVRENRDDINDNSWSSQFYVLSPSR